MKRMGNAVTHSVTTSPCNAVTNAFVTLPPTRPDPTRPELLTYLGFSPNRSVSDARCASAVAAASAGLATSDGLVSPDGQIIEALR